MNKEHSTPADLDREPTYHKTAVPYVLPNDAPEHLRLEAQHLALEETMGGEIIHAPLTSPFRILDVGCGTGVVTTRLAHGFQSAAVYGIDLSPVPDIHGPQLNVKYLQGNLFDLASTAPLDRHSFDFIFSRLLICGMNDWPRYVRTAAELLRSDGYLETHDLDWIWYDGEGNVISDGWEWLRVMRETAEAGGLDDTCGSHVAGWMRDAGLRDVTVKRYVWPFGYGWKEHPEAEGLAHYGVPAMPVMFQHALRRTLEGKCSEEKIKEYQEQMKRDFEPETGKHWVFYVTVGRRE